MALSTVNASRVAAGPAKLALDLEQVMIMRAVTGGTSGAPATPVAGVRILSPPPPAPQQVYPALSRGDHKIT